jgi:hypothetical protein
VLARSGVDGFGGLAAVRFVIVSLLVALGVTLFVTAIVIGVARFAEARRVEGVFVSCVGFRLGSLARS